MSHHQPSLRWLINEYRGRGLFPYLFGISMILALLVALLSTIVTLIDTDPTEPWGTYSTPIYVGNLLNDGTDTVVSRTVAADGVPIVNGPEIPVVAIRCGPPERLDVVSQRFWTITTAPGIEGLPVDRMEGRRVPITLDPSPDPSDCQIITTTITMPDDVAARAEGNVVRVRADIAAANQAYTPVSATSEHFYYRADGIGAELEPVTLGRVPIELP